MRSLFIVLLMLSSCSKEPSPDQGVWGKELYFTIISKKNGEDLVFGANPIFPFIDGFEKKVVLCTKKFLDGISCSDKLGTNAISRSTLNGKILLSTLLREEYVDQRFTTLTIADSLVYKIDYKLLDYDTFYKTKPADNHFLELYINDALECKPCKPDHVVVFKI